MMVPKRALALTGLLALGALAVVGYAMHTAQPAFGYRFWALFVLALVTARLKVQLPGLTGNMAVSLPYFLLASTQLSMLEALLVALPACAVQCFPKRGGTQPQLVQFLFNLSTMAVVVAATSLIGAHDTLLGAMAYFMTQTVLVASIIHLTEGGAIHETWCRIAHHSFPFYVLSAGMAMIVTSTVPQLGWQVPVLGLAILYAIYRSYETYFDVPKAAQG